MDDKLQHFVKSLTEKELYQLQDQLGSKENKMRELVQRQLLELQASSGKACATCMGGLEPASIHNYQLIFGPHDLRKQAFFCGIDCLEYFIIRLKARKQYPLIPQASPEEGKRLKSPLKQEVPAEKRPERPSEPLEGDPSKTDLFRQGGI
ncbi:MAG: hypothetical protein GXP63_01110 [DPANN group archaeon]|nr:hypothetical protein [DPANN group archaeon]